jgi:tetratricopeptide (TPR) repeat protein
MRCVALRIVVVALAGVWLAGCGTSSVLSELDKPAADGAQATDAQAIVQADTQADGTKAMAQAVETAPMPPPGSSQGLLGSDSQDDLSLGKKYYRAGDFGLAEKHFRQAVETHASDAEAWLGLAASYDQLRRFDLADRAYKQAIRIAGLTVEIINNQGYSYMLRGDYRKAAATLAQAAAKAPENPYVKNNIRLLAESTHQKKAIE